MSPDIYDTLGWVYYKKGLYSPAVEQLKKAVALDETEANRSGHNARMRHIVCVWEWRWLRRAINLRRGEKSKLLCKIEQNLSEKEIQDAKNFLANL